MKAFYLLVTLLALPMAALAQPNILLVIADDLGVDYFNGYQNSALLPTTPTLDGLRANGVTFMKAYSTPKCTPSRSAIMSGKYDNKTGVTGTPGHLDTVHTSIFRAIEQQTNGLYSDAVIGKWHVSYPIDSFHPRDHGVDYYTGFLSSQVTDYYAWERSENGVTTTDSTYVTTALTDASIDWIKAQTQPWFLWLAHAAPHGPFHEPPSDLYSIQATGTNARKYVAMIEAIDHELGRLLDSIPPAVLSNTLIIFVGDNGTPTNLTQNYPAGRGKSTIYEGGIHVPMIVAGQGVTRQGETEDAMVHVTDLYATLLEVAGASLPGGIYNSLSFDHLLTNDPGPVHTYNYSELTQGIDDDFAIRTDRYKLLEFTATNTQEFYDLQVDSLETNDLLLTGLTTAQQAIKADLEVEAAQRRSAWSCRDHIQNGDEIDIDCGGTYCAPCVVGVRSTDAPAAPLRCFPNPVHDALTVVSPTDAYQLELWTPTGQCVAQQRCAQATTTLSVRDLPSGVYFVRVVDAVDQVQWMGQFVKE